MGIAFKIILGLIGVVFVLGIIFYLWMLWAWTPKKPEPSHYLSQTIKEDVLARDIIEGGVAYKIVQEAADTQAPKEYRVMIWRPRHEQNARFIVYVEGTPIPKEVKITKKGFVEVYFDGLLQDGQEGLNIAVDEEFYRYEGVTVINGAVGE